MKSKRRGPRVVISKTPKVIRNYNAHMGGVDGADQMLYQYLDDRKCLKFWKKVTLNLFSRMLLNAYILYKANTTRPLTHHAFLVSIVETVGDEWIQHRETTLTPPRVRPTNVAGGAAYVARLFTRLPGTREMNCCVCSPVSTKAGGKRKKSSYQCAKCKRGVHTRCYPLHSC